jgi:hypothetical protein
MKTGLDTLGTAPNESKIAKHEKRDLTPFEPSKKIFRSAKHENEI